MATFLKQYGLFTNSLHSEDGLTYFFMLGDSEEHFRKILEFICIDIHYTLKKYQLLIEKWLDNAIWRTGHIDADLHPGKIFNQFIDLKSIYKTKSSTYLPIREREEIERPFLTLIDFGSFPQLTENEREGMINLILSIGVFSKYSKNPFRFSQLYKTLNYIVQSDKQIYLLKNKRVKKKIISGLKKIENGKNLSPGQIVKETLQILMSNNIDDSLGITQFGRGHTMLEQTYIDLENIKELVLEYYVNIAPEYLEKIRYKVLYENVPQSCQVLNKLPS